MGYLDELNALLNGDDTPSGDADWSDAADGDYVETARRQLDNGTTSFWEEPAGTFHACGARYGCGYAEALVVVDPQTGHATVDIDSNLPISPENQPAARKIFRRLNREFIVAGLEVGANGTMHFVAQDGCDLAKGEDVDSFAGKGFYTVHSHAHMVAQLEAGRDPLLVLHSNDDR
jgi:hypothetical protein